MGLPGAAIQASRRAAWFHLTAYAQDDIPLACLMERCQADVLPGTLPLMSLQTRMADIIHTLLHREA